MTQLGQTGETGIRLHDVMATIVPFVWSVNDNFTGELGDFSQAEKNVIHLSIDCSCAVQYNLKVSCNRCGS